MCRPGTVLSSFWYCIGSGTGVQTRYSTVQLLIMTRVFYWCADQVQGCPASGTVQNMVLVCIPGSGLSTESPTSSLTSPPQVIVQRTLAAKSLTHAKVVEQALLLDTNLPQ